MPKLRSSNRWQAQLNTVNGTIGLGTYTTKEQALIAENTERLHLGMICATPIKMYKCVVCSTLHDTAVEATACCVPQENRCLTL